MCIYKGLLIKGKMGFEGKECQKRLDYTTILFNQLGRYLSNSKLVTKLVEKWGKPGSY